MTQPTLIYSQPVMRPPNPFGPVPGAQVCIFKIVGVRNKSQLGQFLNKYFNIFLYWTNVLHKCSSSCKDLLHSFLYPGWQHQVCFTEAKRIAF